MNDQQLKDMCVYLGIQLPAEAYGSVEERLNARDVRRDLPPCIDTFCNGAEAALRVIHSHECRGDTSSPAYESAVETAWMAIDLVVGYHRSPDKERPFQTHVGRGVMHSLPDCMAIGGPSCIDWGKMGYADPDMPGHSRRREEEDSLSGYPIMIDPEGVMHIVAPRPSSGVNAGHAVLPQNIGASGAGIVYVRKPETHNTPEPLDDKGPFTGTGLE